MTIKAASVVPVRVELKRADPSGETWVLFRTATYRDDLVRGELLRDRVYVPEDGGIAIKVDVNIYLLHAEELWITYEDASIVFEPSDKEVEGETLFRPRAEMTRPEFMQALGKLPRAVVTEWHNAVIEGNRDWQYPF